MNYIYNIYLYKGREKHNSRTEKKIKIKKNNKDQKKKRETPINQMVYCQHIQVKYYRKTKITNSSS